MSLAWKLVREECYEMASRNNLSIPAVHGKESSGDIAPIRSVKGSLAVTSNKKLKKVIKLELNTSRNLELFNESFSEITISRMSGQLTLTLDSPESVGMTIDKVMSIETPVNQFYITNGSGSGYAELWLWE